MATITFEQAHVLYPGADVAGGPGIDLDDRRRRVHGPGRPVGLRQVDRAADARGARGGRRSGRDPDRRPRRHRRRPEEPRHRDGVPELRALPAHDRRRQHRLPAQDRARSPKAEREARRVDDAAEMLGLDRAPRPQARAALGRPAPARRDGPRDRARAAGLPDGRAAVEPRREAARRDARRHRASCSGGCRRRPSTSPTTRSRR